MRRGARVGMNSGFVAGGKAVGAAISLGALAVAAKALAVEEVGSLLVLHALVLFCSEALTFKTSLTVVRYGTGPAMANDTDGLARVLRFCATLDAASSLVAFVIALAAGLALRAFLPALAALPTELLLGYLCLVLLRQISASLGTLRLLDRFGTLGAHALIQPSVRLLGGLLALQMGWGLPAFVVIYFSASALSHISLIGLAVWRMAQAGLIRAIPRGLSFAAPAPDAWRFSILTNAEGTLGTLVSDAPVVLAGLLLGGGDAAVFKVAQDAASLLTGGVKVVDRAMFPELAKMAAEGGRRELVALARRISAVLAVVGAAMAGLVLLIGPAPLIAVFGKPEYGLAATPLAVLFLAAAFSGASTPFLSAFYANGRPGHALMARSAEAGGFLALVWPLSALFGVVGAAAAILAGAAAFAALTFRLAVRQSQDCQAADRAALAASATSPTEAERSGGPGQPASILSAPTNARGPSYRGSA